MNWLFVKRLRSFVVLAGLSSLVLNVALLMPAVYMMQVFDRVFASGSVETLVDARRASRCSFLALGYFLDTVRARALAWAGRSLDRKLAPAAVRSSLEQAAAGPGRVDTDALRDIAQLRAFLSGPGVLALFDAPWLPIYLLVITLMHPMLGLAPRSARRARRARRAHRSAHARRTPNRRCAVRAPRLASPRG